MSHFDDIFRIVKSTNFQEDTYGAYQTYPFKPFSFFIPVVISPDCRTILCNNVIYVYDELEEKYFDPGDKTKQFQITIEGTYTGTPEMKMINTKDHTLVWVVSLYKRATTEAITSLVHLLKKDHHNLSDEVKDMIKALIAKL